MKQSKKYLVEQFIALEKSYHLRYAQTLIEFRRNADFSMHSFRADCVLPISPSTFKFNYNTVKHAARSYQSTVCYMTLLIHFVVIQDALILTPLKSRFVIAVRKVVQIVCQFF